MIEKLAGAEVWNVLMKKKGTITNVNENGMLMVLIDGKGKKFLFPHSFVKTLTAPAVLSATDAQLQNEIELYIEELESQKKPAPAKEPIPTKKAKELVTPARTSNIQKEFLNIGETFNTHAAALNECFGFDYKQFQQAYIVLNAKYAAWFPSIAKQENDAYVPTATSNGWINVLSENETVITECNEDPAESEPRDEKNKLDRFVFAKFDDQRAYRFIGVYKLIDDRNNTPGVFRYERIGTKVNLHTFEME